MAYGAKDLALEDNSAIFAQVFLACPTYSYCLLFGVKTAFHKVFVHSMHRIVRQPK
jgi:D-serine dehydratase